MKFASPKLCLAVASAALLFAGCTKKPVRPSPSDTAVMGGPNAGYQGPSSVDITPEGLQPRTGGFDPSGHDRETLKAQAVYFDFDKWDIKASEREKLRIAKEHLDKNPSYRLLLEGRCDWRGTAEYNLGLGDRRANAAKRYLQSLGIAPDRLETSSKGSLDASKNADDATMAKDRRVDLVVVNPSAIAPSGL